MVSIWTPFPESVVKSLSRISDNAWFDILWKLFITLLTLSFILVLGAAGGVWGILAGAIAFILTTVLLGDNVRQAFDDIWNRNFWVFDP